MNHSLFLACLFSWGVLLENVTVVGAIGSKRRFIRHLASCNCKEYTDDICRGYYQGGGSSFLPDDYKECAPICCIKCDCQKITEQTCKECLDEGKCASEELYACAKKCCVATTPKPTKKPHPQRHPTKAPQGHPTKAPQPDPTPEPSSKPRSSGSSKGSRNGGGSKSGGKGLKGAKSTSGKHGKDVHEKKHSAKKKPPEKIEIVESSSDVDFKKYYGSYIYHDKHSHGNHWKSDDDSESESSDDDKEWSSDEEPRDSSLSPNGTVEVEIPNPANNTLNGTVVNSTSPVAPVAAPIIRVNVSVPSSIPTVNVTANITQSNATTTSTTVVVTRAGPTTYEILLNNTKSSNSSNSANSSNNKKLNMALIIGIVGISIAGIAAVTITSRRVSALPPISDDLTMPFAFNLGISYCWIVLVTVLF